jgi:hypothetical protein
MTKGKNGKHLEGIINVVLLDDNNGKYIPYCILPYHPGVIFPTKASLCEEKKCEKYIKLYIKNGLSLKAEEFDK